MVPAFIGFLERGFMIPSATRLDFIRQLLCLRGRLAMLDSVRVVFATFRGDQMSFSGVLVLNGGFVQKVRDH
jgi:hypothetical protein